MRRLVLVLIVITGLGAIGWVNRVSLASRIPAAVVGITEREKHVWVARLAGTANAASGASWLRAGDDVALTAAEVPLPITMQVTLSSDQPAVAWRVGIQRGQQLRVTAAADRAFIDVLDVAGKNVVEGTSGPNLTWVAEGDGHHVVRVQAPLGAELTGQLTVRAEASMAFPVPGRETRGIASRFGDARDGGSRRHEGVDIFAPRGTPVVAVDDGWVTGSTTNRLGGNVVWVWSPARRVASYYAHLDRRAVNPGERVRAGEVVGYVGNTGNARSTSPHLHFGIYARPGGAVDPLPFICDPPCGERLMQRRATTRRS